MYKTVITYGTFDLLHYGHLLLLKRCKQLGDKLIVGVSTDEMCLAKGKETKFKLNQRMELISDLKYVDLVIPEYTMAQKVTDIEKYNVNIFVLGDDYKEKFKQMPEYNLIKDKVEIVFLERTPDISTTILKHLEGITNE